MEDKLSIDGWNYWLRLPNWHLDVALSVLTGYDPRGSNHRHYFKHNTRAKILSDHFISCCLSSASYDDERKVTSIGADPKPPKEWIDAFLLMDDAKLPFPLPDSECDKPIIGEDIAGESEMNTMRALAIMAWILSENKPALSIAGRPNSAAIGAAIEPLAMNIFGDDVRGFKAFHKKISKALALIDVGVFDISKN